MRRHLHFSGFLKLVVQFAYISGNISSTESNPSKMNKTCGYYWRSKDKLISDILQWTPTYGHTSVDQPAKTNIHQLGADIGCHLENLPGVVDDRDGWQERVKGLCTICTTWLWRSIFNHIYMNFAIRDSWH